MIDDVVIRELTPHGDARGFFVETWRKEWFPAGFEPLQANRADRAAGSVTGLHFHLHQVDWWYFSHGRARFVLVDLREGSPTKGEIMSEDLDASRAHVGIFVPRGVAHGFSAITDSTLSYLVDRTYDPSDENGVAWDDPDLAIDWGVTDAIVTDRDASNPRLSELPPVVPSR
ncbi:MAG: dTDP-4-dehydrorhamnose 3,5-epimerase [Actinomycetota bacterium]|nr:dTDP-4-dehydrorhamnose 3,5-epimerase [Actinomycetota bacterium]